VLDERDITALLRLRGQDQEQLFAQARQLRAERFGDQVVVRAVCEVTNLCRVDCEFCPMRRSNTRRNDTYHQTPDELVTTARRVHDMDVNVICLQGGEIPQTTRTVTAAIPPILDLYRGNIEILLNLGNKTYDEYAQVKHAGATSYIIKHETSDPSLSQRMRHQALDTRLGCIADLLTLGYRVGTGTIVGLPGSTPTSIARDITLARELGVHMCSASPFVPAPDTPLAHCPPGDVPTTLNAIAVMRLVNPDWAIPSVSALSKLSPGAQTRGLMAGANVINVNATAPEHRDRYLIYGKDRLVAGWDYIRNTIRDAGLTPGHSVFIPAV
jgi:biotin synthase